MWSKLGCIVFFGTILFGEIFIWLPPGNPNYDSQDVISFTILVVPSLFAGIFSIFAIWETAREIWQDMFCSSFLRRHEWIFFDKNMVGARIYECKKCGHRWAHD